MNAQRLQAKISGMSCSFCVESIKRAYQRPDGVKEVNVSLSHEEALIRYDPGLVTPEELEKTLRQLSYIVCDLDKVRTYEEQREELRETRKRLMVAGLLTLTAFGFMLVMWLGLGQPWFRWPMLALALGTMLGPGFHRRDGRGRPRACRTIGAIGRSPLWDHSMAGEDR